MSDYLKPIKKSHDLASIESELLRITQQEYESELLLAHYLYLVKSKALFKQNDFRSYSSWIKYIIENRSIGKKSKLWQHYNAGYILSELDIPHQEVKCSIKGLELIAKIYKLNKDKAQAYNFFEQLSDENISSKLLKIEYKKQKIITTPTPAKSTQSVCLIYIDKLSLAKRILQNLTSKNLGYLLFSLFSVSPIY